MRAKSVKAGDVYLRAADAAGLGAAKVDEGIMDLYKEYT